MEEFAYVHAMSRSIKCFAIIDIFISIIYMMYNLFFIILICGPMCGYFGAQRFQRPNQ